MIDTETTDAVMINTETKQRRTGMTDGMGRVLIKGSGDLASGIALRLHRAGFRILMTDTIICLRLRLKQSHTMRVKIPLEVLR